MNIFPEKLVNDFIDIATIAGIDIPKGSITIEELPAPHKSPSSLPENKMAVYIFSWNDICLKVGKVGPKSLARYTSQHYNPKSSRSNLAKSLLHARKNIGLGSLEEKNVGRWIKSNTYRINILLDKNLGVPVLTLLEAFLQCRLKPKFEGFESQKRN